MKELDNFECRISMCHAEPVEASNIKPCTFNPFDKLRVTEDNYMLKNDRDFKLEIPKCHAYLFEA